MGGTRTRDPRGCEGRGSMSGYAHQAARSQWERAPPGPARGSHAQPGPAQARRGGREEPSGAERSRTGTEGNRTEPERGRAGTQRGRTEPNQDRTGLSRDPAELNGAEPGASGAERDRTRQSRDGAGPKRGRAVPDGAEAVRSGSEQSGPGSARPGAGPGPVAAMRPLPVPLLLLLLSPVPGRAGGCPPCPRGVPEPCDSRCPPCARTRSPAEEEPEEPCPPCPPCSHEATAPLAEGTPPVPGTPRVTPPVSGAPPEPPGDIIPLYCALLAGLVVGLVAYVAFKCWDTCRKKRQLDKARDAGDAAVAADAEKLRGDSGACPDSAGLEPPQPPPPEGPSPRRQEEPAELERLLELGAPGSDRRGPGDITSAV